MNDPIGYSFFAFRQSQKNCNRFYASICDTLTNVIAR